MSSAPQLREGEIWVSAKELAARRAPRCRRCGDPGTHPACKAKDEREREAERAAIRQRAEAHKRHPDRLFETAPTPAERSTAERWFSARPDLLDDVQRNKLIVGRCRKYGLTVGGWMAMVARQASRCAICEVELHPLKLCIDHDHVTGAVRGLLCQSCNTGIGMLGIDGAEARRRASSVTRYLRFVNVTEP